eukprot:CCRYP_019649-RA/>CCRYP_019649-RA protein AED:0.30 eAED:0.27 QI:0/0/0/1/1/1/2/0/555
MASTEDNILELIGVSGGEISLSLLKERYKKYFGFPIGTPASGKFRDWITSFGSIGIKKGKGSNDIAVYDKRSESLVEPPEERIRSLIRESGGEISLSSLRSRYNEVYNESLECPRRNLRIWIESMNSVKTRRTGSDYFAYEIGVTPRRTAGSLSALNPHSQLIDEFVIISGDNKLVESEGFSIQEENVDDEPKLSNQEIASKLMAYNGGHFKPIQVHQDSKSLLEILPVECTHALCEIGMEHVSDIVYDLGRMPYCWANNERKYFFDDNRVVEYEDIEDIVKSLQEFGDDNRAGIDGQLHRISSIRNNKNSIIGLTIRVGRHVEGNADMIRDLLQETKKSILLLGEPGSGKTTIVREVTNILSLEENVFIVDTSNEIAGDGDVPHHCVGDARRMMVKSLGSQAGVMIECVQNHTPSVMVIDEIGRKREVEAAQTSQNRGVRMIASAHGDLRSLVKNKELRGLIGGLETVTLGDDEAKALQKKSGSQTIKKQMTLRAAAPIFDIIIELKRGRLHEWHVVEDSAKAVDKILSGHKYDIQKRMRCMMSGNIFVEQVKS